MGCAQVIALPPVEAVTSGAVLASEVAACDEKVDIWALGVTIYELLTGARHRVLLLGPRTRCQQLTDREAGAKAPVSHVVVWQRWRRRHDFAVLELTRRLVRRALSIRAMDGS